MTAPGRPLLMGLGGASLLAALALVGSAPEALATACGVSVKAVRLTRPVHVQEPSGPLAFTGANVTTALLLAAALLGLGAVLVILARRRPGRASAPVLAGLVGVALLVGGIAAAHSASAAPAATSVCTPAGSPLPVHKPVSVDATSVTKPSTTAVTATGTTGTTPTGTTPTGGGSTPSGGGTTPPATGTTADPPAALPEAPLPVAVLVAGLVSGGWLLRRRTRPRV